MWGATPGGQLQPVLMRHPPKLPVKTWEGRGQLGGGSCRGSGGGLAGGQGGVQLRVGGGGLGLGLGSPSWWNRSWFYNPF